MRGQRGTPLAYALALTVADRFWSKVAVAGPDECWEWQAAERVRGYGRIRIGGRNGGKHLAHRVALVLGTGRDLDTRLSIHSCDNPPCCNPAHLRVGTPSDNQYDRAERQPESQVRGEDQWKAVLTPAKVRYLRGVAASGGNIAEASRLIGCSEGAARSVIKRRTWKHVA